MGVSSVVLRDGPNNEAQEIAVDNMQILAAPACGSIAAIKLTEKQPVMRRKGMEKSVLDDIMGDPDDFRDLGESDAESDWGRWEDNVRDERPKRLQNNCMKAQLWEPQSMDGYDCLFCGLCGTLLSFESQSTAVCPLCHSSWDIKDLQGREFCYTTSFEDLVRRLGFEPLVKPQKKVREEHAEVQKHATVNDECPKCHHPQLEYYTRQLRSADEGQTVFYECPNCHYKFAQNM